MSQSINPFEHHHDHGPEEADEVLDARAAADPGQRALADALRVTFGILKVVMLVLVVLYIFSGLFRVKQQTQAVYLRFGKIVGDPGKQVLGPGWYFGLPFPVGRVVEFPTKTKQLEIDRDFWFEVPKDAVPGTTMEESAKKGPLNPELDGSMITGDANILHARWTVEYQIVDPVAFIENVRSEPDKEDKGQGQPEQEDKKDPNFYTATARKLVIDTVEDAAVFAMAQTPADTVFRGNPRTDLVKVRAQERLAQLKAGVAINNVQARTLFPAAVRDAFKQVTDAQSQRDQRMKQAQAKATSTLSSAAGEAADALIKVLDDYEVTQRGEDEAAKAAAENRITTIFTDLEVPGPQGTLKITGEAARSISRARSDRVNLVETVRSEAETFKKQLKQYRESPTIQLSRWWAQARKEIYSAPKNTIQFFPPGPLVIDMNRDPALMQQRREEAIKENTTPVLRTH